MATSDVKLISASDPVYRSVASHYKRNGGKFPSSSKDSPEKAYGFMIYKLEEAFRSLLSRACGDCDRILSYYENSPHRSSRHRRRKRLYHRELDYVSGKSSDPLCFVEIKTRGRSNANCATKKDADQLEKSLAIGKTRWPDLCGALVMVDLSGIYEKADNTEKFDSIDKLIGYCRKPEGESVFLIPGNLLIKELTENELWSTCSTISLIEAWFDMYEPMRHVDESDLGQRPFADL